MLDDTLSDKVHKSKQLSGKHCLQLMINMIRLKPRTRISVRHCESCTQGYNRKNVITKIKKLRTAMCNFENQLKPLEGKLAKNTTNKGKSQRKVGEQKPRKQATWHILFGMT